VEEPCVAEALTIAAMLSGESIYYRPPPSRKEGRDGRPEADSNKPDAATAAHAQLAHPLGDHVTLLRVYELWAGSGYDDAWARRHFINMRALRQARNVRRQLADIVAHDNNDSARAGSGSEQATAERGGKPPASSSSSSEVLNTDRGRPLGAFDASLLRSLRQAVTAGFFLNAALRVGSSDAAVYKMMAEGTAHEFLLVTLSPSSAVALVNEQQHAAAPQQSGGQPSSSHPRPVPRLPPCVVCSEVTFSGGTQGGKGHMGQVCVVEQSWVLAPHRLPRARAVDTLRLTGRTPAPEATNATSSGSIAHALTLRGQPAKPGARPVESQSRAAVVAEAQAKALAMAAAGKTQATADDVAAAKARFLERQAMKKR
jgi:hypothetical protein